jgi:hypothetical protein
MAASSQASAMQILRFLDGRSLQEAGETLRVIACANQRNLRLVASVSDRLRFSRKLRTSGSALNQLKVVAPAAVVHPLHGHG